MFGFILKGKKEESEPKCVIREVLNFYSGTYL